MDQTSNLYTLVYVSTAAEQLSTEELKKILDKSRSNNSKENITGMLAYSNGNIFQILEGNKAQLDSLFSKIKTDTRHLGIITLLNRPIENRCFPEWSMGFKSVSNHSPDWDGYIDTHKSDLIECQSGKPNAVITLLKDFIKNNS